MGSDRRPCSGARLRMKIPAARAAEAQIRDGEDGYVASSLADRSTGIARLASDAGQAVAMGQAGREHARARFLLTRLLVDELGTIASLLGREPGDRERAGVAA